MPDEELEGYWQDTACVGGGLSAVRVPGVRLEKDWEVFQRFPECIYYPSFSGAYGFKLWELQTLAREHGADRVWWRAIPRRVLWGELCAEDATFLGKRVIVFQRDATEELAEAVRWLQDKAQTPLTCPFGLTGQQWQRQLNEIRVLDPHVLASHPLEVI